MFRDVLAYIVITVHYAYLAYLLIGGFVAWRWPKTIGFHVLAAIWAGLIVFTSVPCPLTALQNHLREGAGKPPLSDSFINLYVQGIFYPHGAEVLSQVVVGVLVLGSWLGLWLRHRKRHRTQGPIAHRPEREVPQGLSS